jgi:AraC-like DNA-binding protein/mannose-6-phosphate isomerase-like protein (cupin superfamily)
MAPRTATYEARRFSTAGLPIAQQMEMWEAHHSKLLMALECRALSSRTFAGSSVSVETPRTVIERIRASTPHVIERRVELIRRHPAESVVLFLVLSGEAFFYNDDVTRTMRPGQMLICDADTPFIRGFGQHHEELSIKIPRSVSLERWGTERIERPRFLGPADATGVVVRSLAAQLDSATQAGPRPSLDEALLLELTAVALGHRHAGYASAYAAAARTYIDSHLAERDLSAAAIAAAVGISPRHLSRVFSAEGTTVPQYLLAQRLDAASVLLQGHEAATLTIADTAHRCGFSSVSRFSSAFTARFGEHASDVRRRAAQLAALTGQPKLASNTRSDGYRR